VRSSSFLLAAIAAAIATPTVRAQWVTFQDQTASRLVASAALVANDTQEKDYAWADFDQDGDTDLVIVRKQPFTSPGKFPNVLLMNESGVLTDRTTQYASASLIAGSQGMLDATNDRDVVCADVNGDGWVDIVTCTTLTATDPQYIRVPRVYINRGNSVGGTWQGFLYDDALRIDDTPWGGHHRFCAVAAGDIDGDGDLDLYFGDYQQGGSRPNDIDDRLLLNNGLGYFTDVSAARMTAEMLESSFAMRVAMHDMNLDGKLDILKNDALNAPQGISISYNNGPSPGFFSSYQIAYAFTPYHFTVGDLNNDNLPDMIVGDDGQDQFILHQGVVGGLATFGPATPFTYQGGGGDDGFPGNNIIADLNNDGWNDAVMADVDVDIAGCGRRCKIFRNLGNAPNVTMREEIVAGAVGGIPTSSLVGTFDVAVFDINGDGWKDMVIGRCTGTQIWMNQPPTGVTFSYVGGLPSMLAPGSVRTLDVNAAGIGGVVPQAGTGRIYTSINGGAFTMAPMADIGPGQFRATLPGMPACGGDLRFYVSVQGQSSTVYTDPPAAPGAAYEVVSAVGTSVLLSENFEGAVPGWTVNNTAVTSGGWVVATPIGTTVGVEFANPNEDAEADPAATRCYVTGNGVVGGTAGAADLDGGPSDLISPTLNFAGTDGFISYRRWFFRSNTTGNDAMVVSVSNDNGINWTTVETVTGPGTNQWLSSSFRVSDFVTPNNSIRVRFRVSDNPNNTTTEAGIDVFRAETFACTLCQENIGLQGPGTSTFSICGGDLSTGSPATFAVQGAEPFATGLLVASLFNNPQPLAGGIIVDPGAPLVFQLPMDGAGNFIVPGFPGGFGNFTLYGQVITNCAVGPQGFCFSNALRIVFKP